MQIKVTDFSSTPLFPYMCHHQQQVYITNKKERSRNSLSIFNNETAEPLPSYYWLGLVCLYIYAVMLANCSVRCLRSQKRSHCIQIS